MRLTPNSHLHKRGTTYHESLVIGASGKTCTHVWQQALEQGHEVSVFVRTASKLEAV